jgi:hypothetical protein
MNTISHPQVTPTSKDSQIERLARVALILSSITAVPGLVYSLYPVYALFISLVEGADGGDWSAVFAMNGLMLVGWWLYYTYWQEQQGRNRLGKISWLVSTVFNGGLVSYFVVVVLRSFADETVTTNINWIVFGGTTMWVLVMTIVSLQVWILKMRRAA